MREVCFMMLVAVSGWGMLVGAAPEPMAVTLNPRRATHVLDQHFVSININPTDLLQGKPFGISNNSTFSILEGLAPAYVRLGGHDTNRYAFKNTKNLDDVHLISDYIISEDHWRSVNELLRRAGLNVVVCLNSAFRTGPSEKWDPRNALQLITFSDKQQYNITWQLGYEPLKTAENTGSQLGKDIIQLRAILNAFPRYQHSDIVGPDVRVLHHKEDVDNALEVLMEAGPAINAVTWHPRWPHASAITPSDASEDGYEFPPDYLEWDRNQLHKLLQRALIKKPFWISEPKAENLGSFAEGLIYARRLSLAAKLGIDVVMKQPCLNDISHPKPEYWVALLHKRTLGRTVLDARPVSNNSEVSVVIQCTSNSYGREIDGGMTVFAVNTAGVEHRLIVRGLPQTKIGDAVHQYVLTAGQEPTAIFSQMTYLNKEPLLMSENGMLPELNPKIKRLGPNLITKLPPYSIGYWVLPHAKIKMCQQEPQSLIALTLDELNAANVVRTTKKGIINLRNITHSIVNKLLNPKDSTEVRQDKKDSSEEIADIKRLSRQALGENVDFKFRERLDDIKKLMNLNLKQENSKNRDESNENNLREADKKIDIIATDLNKVMKGVDQEKEFGEFLKVSGLNQDFGKLMIDDKLAREKNMKESMENNRSKRQINSAAFKLQEDHNDLAEIEKRFRKIIAKHRKNEFNPIKIPNFQLDKINKDFQEDLLLKEISLLEKTEEALSEVMKIHQERHEAVEELLHDELEQMKEEKMASLMEMKKDSINNGENAFFHLNNLRNTLMNDDDKLPPSKRETGDTKESKPKKDQPFSAMRSYLDKRKESLSLRQKSQMKQLVTTEQPINKVEEQPKEVLKLETTTEHPLPEPTKLTPNNEKRRSDVLKYMTNYIDQLNAKKAEVAKPPTIIIPKNLRKLPVVPTTVPSEKRVDEKTEEPSIAASPGNEKINTFRAPRADWKKSEISDDISEASKQIIKRSDFSPSDDKMDGKFDVKRPTILSIKSNEKSVFEASGNEYQRGREPKEKFIGQHKSDDSKEPPIIKINKVSAINAAEFAKRQLNEPNVPDESDKDQTIDEVSDRKTIIQRPTRKERINADDIKQPIIYATENKGGDGKPTILQNGKGSPEEPMVSDQSTSEHQNQNKPVIELINKGIQQNKPSRKVLITQKSKEKHSPEKSNPDGFGLTNGEGNLNSKFETVDSQNTENSRNQSDGIIEKSTVATSPGKQNPDNPQEQSKGPAREKHIVEKFEGSPYPEGPVVQKPKGDSINEERVNEKQERNDYPSVSIIKQRIISKYGGKTIPEEPIVKQSTKEKPEGNEHPASIKQFVSPKSEGKTISDESVIKQFSQENPEGIQHSNGSPNKQSGGSTTEQSVKEIEDGNTHTILSNTQQFIAPKSEGKNTPEESIVKQFSQAKPERNEHANGNTIKQSDSKQSEGEILKQSVQEAPGGIKHTSGGSIQKHFSAKSEGPNNPEESIVKQPVQEKTDGNKHSIVSTTKQFIAPKSKGKNTPEESIVKQFSQENPERNEHANGNIIKQSEGEIVKQSVQETPEGIRHASGGSIQKLFSAKSEGPNHPEESIVKQPVQEKTDGNKHSIVSTAQQFIPPKSEGKNIPEESSQVIPEGIEHSNRQAIQQPIYEKTTGKNIRDGTTVQQPKISEGNEHSIGTIAKQYFEENPAIEHSARKASDGIQRPDVEQTTVKPTDDGEFFKKSDNPSTSEKHTTEGSAIKRTSVESNKQANRQKITKFREGRKLKPNTEGITKEKSETTMGSQTTEGIKYETEATSIIEKTGSFKEGRAKRNTKDSEETPRIDPINDDGSSTSSEKSISNSILKLPSKTLQQKEKPDANENLATSTFNLLLNEVFPTTFKKAKEAIDSLNLPEYLHNFGKMMENFQNVDKLIKDVAVPVQEKSEHVQIIDRNKRELENTYFTDFPPTENSVTASSTTFVTLSQSTEKLVVSSTIVADSTVTPFLKLANKLDAILVNETVLDTVLENMAEEIVYNETARHNADIDKNENVRQESNQGKNESEVPESHTEKNNIELLEMIKEKQETSTEKLETPKEKNGIELPNTNETVIRGTATDRPKKENHEIKEDMNGASTEKHQVVEQEIQTEKHGIEPLEFSTEKNQVVGQEIQTDKNGIEPLQRSSEKHQEMGYVTSTEKNQVVGQEIQTEKNGIEPLELSTEKHQVVGQEIQTDKKGIEPLQRSTEKLQVVEKENTTEKNGIEPLKSSTAKHQVVAHEIKTEKNEIEKHYRQTEINGLEPLKTFTENRQTSKLESSTPKIKIENHELQSEKMTVRQSETEITRPEIKEQKIIKSKKHKHKHDKMEDDDPLSPRLEIEKNIIEEIIRKLMSKPIKETKHKRNIFENAKKNGFKRETTEHVQKGYTIVPEEGDARELFRQMKPGVYVVPSKDMSNVHAEQISRGAVNIQQGKKMPNVLSLNIYYDKQPGTEEAENNVVEEDKRFYKYDQQWPKQQVNPPMLQPYKTTKSLYPSVMQLPQPTIGQHYKTALPMQQSQPIVNQPYQTILPMQPIIQPPTRNMYNNRYQMQPQSPQRHYSNMQPPTPQRHYSNQQPQPNINDPYLINQQSSDYYYQQPKEVKSPEVIPISSFSSTWSINQLNHRKIPEEFLLPDKEDEVNTEEEQVTKLDHKNEENKESEETNKQDIPSDDKRKSIERYWNRTLAEIFQETKKDPFWEFMKEPSKDSDETIEVGDDETSEKIEVKNDKREENEEKSRKRRSLNSNNYFDTKPFDNAWKQPQENTIKYLLKNNIINKNSELVKNLLENSIAKLRIPQYNPFDHNRIHKNNPRKIFEKTFEIGGPMDSGKEVTNFQFVSPQILVTPDTQKISTPNFIVTASNAKSNPDYESDPFQQFYDMAVELIKSALESIN